MTFFQSISTCLEKYASFSGRASRSEYWFWGLFLLLIQFLIGFFGGMIVSDEFKVDVISKIVHFATLLPSIAVGVRRCHDTNHNGLCLFIPVYNLVLMCLPSDPDTNDYGALEH